MLTRLTSCIGAAFYAIYKALIACLIEELWCKGGRGSLKSSFISIIIILGIIADPKANAIVFRRYKNALRDTVLGQLEWAIDILGVTDKFRITVSPMRITYLPTGQKILFQGADDPKKVKSSNFAKGYVKYAWFEEVDEFGGMKEIRSILQTFFRGKGGHRVALFSYNPPKSRRSWVNQEVTIKKKGRYVHHSDYRSAPPDWLGERFISEAEHIKRVNPDAYDHEYLGLEIGTGLEIFNNVTIRTIEQEEIDALQYHFNGLDFGYATDPLAWVRMAYVRKYRRLYIYDERSGLGISNRKFAEEIIPEEYKYDMITADSAEPKSVDVLNDEYNMDVYKALKGPGSVNQGTKWLEDLEEIIIDPERAPLAAKEFVNYSFALRKGSDDIINKYPDKDNHTIDAVRYAMEDTINGETGDIATGRA